MGQIRLLTDEVIGKIAAGEVVERPAAAIKELVENSLDAGATAVTVEIRDGGISYFRVTDNGSGIRQNEIRMAFERHATSKISSTDDLFSIATLGFRGEALASIAAVAKVTCTTRTAEDATGIKVQNDGGQITSIQETACPQGTTFVVKEMFYNTPVRLKFLKKPVTEAGYVSDLMMRLILSRPDVSFRYISQGKTLYHSAGDGQTESAVYCIYGSEMARTMRKVDACEGGVVLKGYVGIGEAGRSNRAHESFFINGRYMRSQTLSLAVESGCRERIMIGKYPVCVLHLTMPYDMVDVNVHPNKLEVRFQNEAGVAQAVENMIRDAISDRDAIARPPQIHLAPETPKAAAPVSASPVMVVQTEKRAVEIPAQPAVQKPVVVKAEAVPETLPADSEKVSNSYLQQVLPVPKAPVPVMQQVSELEKKYLQQELPEPGKIVSKQEAEQLPSFLPEEPKPLKLLGTLFDTYIILEYEDNLLLIDQHAVHERLRFDRLMKAWDQHEAGQELLVPLVMQVTRREQELLEANKELLERMGLTVEPFGTTEVSIRSVPMILGEPQAEALVRDILDQLMSERGSITFEKRRSAILQIACKKAVKGGDVLSESDIRYLVTQMIDQKVTPTCPHGRPLVVALSHQELDKYFRRIQ